MEIDFLYAGCADAIHIRFIGNDGSPHNLMVDGGSEKGDLFEDSLKARINLIVNKRKELIDIWIITHIDDDHIGGILRLLKESDLLKQTDLSRTEFWFNYSIWDYETGITSDNLKSVEQGITLRDYLLKNSKCIKQITNLLQPIDIWGATATVLSPSDNRYKKQLALWKGKEKIIRQKEPSSLKDGEQHDYDTHIEDFDLSKQERDSSAENASSIALVIKYKDEQILLSADSHPGVLVASIKKYWPKAKLKLKYMQVPHHGSRRNTNDKLLALIDCENYIISADGYNKHNLPNKETLVRILKANPNKKIVFHITKGNSLTRAIFDADSSHEIDVQFPNNGENFLNFTLA